MTFVTLLLWAFMALLGASAVVALVWAVRNGQLSDFQAGATSIFDEEEPIGLPTDAFPGEGCAEAAGARPSRPDSLSDLESNDG